MQIDRYSGKGLGPGKNENNLYPYLADKRLADAVNMAIVLRRPLLVKGQPGCGKTRLAGSIAYELGLPLREWYVKSTSRARDGLYTIDMVRRLQDAATNNPKAQRIDPYVRFGSLGEALRTEAESVLLIDEIDKADIDFPNDLLRELDEKKFTIEELDDEFADSEGSTSLKKTYEATVAPIIVITSNDEKELPDAFLRRCLFFYIEFPGREQLIEIAKVNVPELKLNIRLVEKAVDRLEQIRAKGNFRKAPATSELIDWIRILHHWGVDFAELDKAARLTDLPHWQVLFKHQQDLKRLQQREAEGEMQS
jgi:MoxR-like ATPase